MIDLITIGIVFYEKVTHFIISNSEILKKYLNIEDINDIINNFCFLIFIMLSEFVIKSKYLFL